MRKRKENAKARAARRAPSDDPVQLAGKRAEFLSLPAKVRAMVEDEGLPRLRRLREAVEADAGRPMPPVRVEPWGWVTSDRDSVVFGKAWPLALGEGRFQFGAFFPASTLLVIMDDALLRRILCHEFAHCIWYSARMWTKLCGPTNDGRLMSNVDLPPEELEALSPEEHFTEQAARDRGELIDPAAWFGEWDARNFLAEADHPDLVGANRAFWERWVGTGLPVRKLDMVMRIPGPSTLVVSEEVARRAGEVVGSTGPRPQAPPAPGPQ